MKTPTSFAFSVEDKQLLTRLAEHVGISRAGVIEMLLRAEARRLGIPSNHTLPPVIGPLSRQARQSINLPSASNYTLSAEAHALLAGLSSHFQINRTIILCRLFKAYADKEGLLTRLQPSSHNADAC